MEKHGKFTLTSFEEILDKHIGNEESPERIAFENEVDKALDSYYMGQSIKDAREARKLTQEQLGELVGVKKAQISRWENGRNVSGETLRKVFRALGMPVFLKTELGLYPIA
ncbi:MAG: helix-turn-helix domain-containing protein [Bacteroidales bacterium]|nr:helix-turn-helix domain-containing protein [Bacteroidales bacterium]